jgi:hypothetical protein
MALSHRIVVLLAALPFILVHVLGAILWKVYQGQGISLALFSGIFCTLYFLLTSIYFMLLFLWFWNKSLQEAD